MAEDSDREWLRICHKHIWAFEVHLQILAQSRLKTQDQHCNKD
jgi:hypothetical protein